MTDVPPTAPGRSCPLHYRYRPEALASAEVPAHLRDLDVLYVVGGLYGNEPALQQVLRLFERERGRRALVFNGDFHWFDTDPAVFARVQREVLAHAAQRGNVETELAAAPPEGEAAAGEAATGQSTASKPATAAADAGCGCAYPEWVGDAVVERSNRILARLRGAASPAQRAELAALPMWQLASVGPWRIGLVHGDAESLAGWGFAQEHLADAAQRDEAGRWFARADVQAFASSHTCLPVFCEWADAAEEDPPGPAAGRWVLNNGAAGMPNFSGDAAGLLIRVALTPFEGPERRFGVQRGLVHAEGVAIEYDGEAWRRRFLADWPVGSDAFASYHERIAQGPPYRLEQVVRSAR